MKGKIKWKKEQLYAKTKETEAKRSKKSNKNKFSPKKTNKKQIKFCKNNNIPYIYNTLIGL